MDRNEINELKRKVNLVKLISDSGIDLTQKGYRWWGLCPFHQEDHASFCVDMDFKNWKCWGCGENGDVITWLGKKYGWTFKKILQFLKDYDCSQTLPPSCHISPQIDSSTVNEMRLESDKRLLQLNRELAFCIGKDLHENQMRFERDEIAPHLFFTKDHYYEAILYRLDAEASSLLHEIQTRR